MDQVIRAAIPIRIKNVMNPRNQGTVITPDPLDGGERCRSRPGMWRGRSVSNLSAMGRLKEREGRLPKRYVRSLLFLRFSIKSVSGGHGVCEYAEQVFDSGDLNPKTLGTLVQLAPAELRLPSNQWPLPAVAISMQLKMLQIAPALASNARTCRLARDIDAAPCGRQTSPSLPSPEHSD